MRYRTIAHLMGILLIILGFSMLLPLLWAIYYQENDIFAFSVTASTSIAIGLFIFFTIKPEGDIRQREGYAIVTLGWLVAAFTGSIPYLLAGTFDNFADAFFETMSGFTTTGASVLTNIEVLPHGILFWRSLTHWLGGMGIMVLFVALLSALGVGGMQMFKAESPGPVAEKIKPRISETAKILWFTYVILTIAEAILLLLAGMNLFDALSHTFGTLATGGFSTKNLSIGFYQNPVIHWIITIFMFASGANFALYYAALKGKSLKRFWESAEFRLYSIIIILAILMISANLLVYTDRGIGDIITTASFQVVSITTTTGYATEDFDQWPLLSKAVIFVLLFVGGCAGSTGGSIKVGRILVLLKQSLLEFQKAIHPRAIMSLKIRGKAVPEEVVLNISQFFFIYILILFIATICMAGLGLDIISSITAVAATLGNVGPGLGQVGPAQNYSSVSTVGKYLLSFLMLLGRLELYTVLVLFLPTFWSRK